MVASSTWARLGPVTKLDAFVPLVPPSLSAASVARSLPVSRRIFSDFSTSRFTISLVVRPEARSSVISPLYFSASMRLTSASL